VYDIPEAEHEQRAENPRNGGYEKAILGGNVTAAEEQNDRP
jgi:hypothetical protein